MLRELDRIVKVKTAGELYVLAPESECLRYDDPTLSVDELRVLGRATRDKPLPPDLVTAIAEVKRVFRAENERAVIEACRRLSPIANPPADVGTTASK